VLHITSYWIHWLVPKVCVAGGQFIAPILVPILAMVILAIGESPTSITHGLHGEGGNAY
jgi:hypothetical protein